MLDQFGHIAEKESQQQRADMGTVDIGISHNDDFMIPDFIEVKVFADAGTERCDNRLELLIVEHLVKPCFFDVQHLSP